MAEKWLNRGNYSLNDTLHGCAYICYKEMEMNNVDF